MLWVFFVLASCWGDDSGLPATLSQRSAALSEYANQHGYSTDHYLLVDLGRNSSQKRAFLIGKDGGVVRSGQVSHGHCKRNLTDVEFSNVSGSNCSSEGRYRIAEKYVGDYGESYRLDGLDATNSNARRRAIVLHSHSCVSDQELGVPICPSEGCPTLSPAMLDELKPIIDGERKPMLLWIYKDEEDAR